MSPLTILTKSFLTFFSTAVAKHLITCLVFYFSWDLVVMAIPRSGYSCRIGPPYIPDGHQRLHHHAQ